MQSSSYQVSTLESIQDQNTGTANSDHQFIPQGYPKSDTYSFNQQSAYQPASSYQNNQFMQKPMVQIPERMSFMGLNAIVTGASSGIGKKIAKLLLLRGAFVVLITRYPERCERILSNPQNVGSGRVFMIDLTDPVSTEREFRNIMEVFHNHLDILINAHGDLSSKPIKETTLRDWDLSTNMNVRSVLQLMSLSSTYLKQTKGAVVNITSTFGEVPKPGSVAFSVSKACLNMLTQCTALELAQYGVRVNAVAAGVTDTKGRLYVDQQIALTTTENASLMKKIGQSTPLNQKVTAKQDIAEAALWLASPASTFVTGEILKVDGGCSLVSAGCLERWSQAKVQDKKSKGLLDYIF